MARAGVEGSRRVVSVAEMARGIAGWGGWSRQGAVPTRLFGDIVRAIVYESRK